MELKNEQAILLVDQIQNAHKISVAFYRRILPSLDEIAVKLGCRFWYWEPCHTDLPGRKKSQPSAQWAWDFVPLFASQHVYWRISGKSACPTDVAISFYLYVDDAFDPENLEKNDIHGQPDPISMPKGRAILQAIVYRPVSKSKKSFEDLYSIDDDVTLEINSCKIADVCKGMRGIAFEWPLSEVFISTLPMVEILKKYTDE